MQPVESGRGLGGGMWVVYPLIVLALLGSGVWLVYEGFKRPPAGGMPPGAPGAPAQGRLDAGMAVVESARSQGPATPTAEATVPARAPIVVSTTLVVRTAAGSSPVAGAGTSGPAPGAVPVVAGAVGVAGSPGAPETAGSSQETPGLAGVGRLGTGEAGGGGAVTSAGDRGPASVGVGEPSLSFPALRLQGIFYRLRKPSAVVNDEVVYVGDMVAGAKVTQIERESVTVSWRGEARELRMEAR